MRKILTNYGTTPPRLLTSKIPYSITKKVGSVHENLLFVFHSIDPRHTQPDPYIMSIYPAHSLFRICPHHPTIQITTDKVADDDA